MPLPLPWSVQRDFYLQGTERSVPLKYHILSVKPGAYERPETTPRAPRKTRLDLELHPLFQDHLSGAFQNTIPRRVFFNPVIRNGVSHRVLISMYRNQEPDMFPDTYSSRKHTVGITDLDSFELKAGS